MSKYLEFEEDEMGKIAVISKRQKAPIGFIDFYVDWNQYIFEPISNAIFNNECLTDIASYLTKLNKEK